MNPPLPFNRLIESLDLTSSGQRMYRRIADLYPICRSITGQGIRDTLDYIKREIALTIHQVPTGTPVLDWTVPREWNIRDAYVMNSRGEKIIDFKKHSLYILNYSVPFRGTLTRAELLPHLHSLPEQPSLIPYRTSYYKEAWGFCLPHRLKDSLPEDTYEVVVDSSLADGHLTYGELVLRGETTDEILFSCHTCHPSLANDNLSGVALVTELATILSTAKRRHTYRFLFIPGTIGAITWLARNEASVSTIKHGLVVACVGDSGPMNYKRSRQGKADIDRAVEHVLKHRGQPFAIRDFSPYGYDERQYCSPGFNLPVGSLTRTPHGQFPEYHTSADNLDFVRPEALADSLGAYLTVLETLDGDARYRNLNPKGEPQLGKRDLYRAMGGLPDAGRQELAMLWVLNLSDTFHTLLDIAEQANLPFRLIRQAASLLEEHKLLEAVT